MRATAAKPALNTHAAGRVGEVLTLQRWAGNAAIQRYLTHGGEPPRRLSNHVVEQLSHLWGAHPGHEDLVTAATGLDAIDFGAWFAKWSGGIPAQVRVEIENLVARDAEAPITAPAQAVAEPEVGSVASSGEEPAPAPAPAPEGDRLEPGAHFKVRGHAVVLECQTVQPEGTCSFLTVSDQRVTVGFEDVERRATDDEVALVSHVRGILRFGTEVSVARLMRSYAGDLERLRTTPPGAVRALIEKSLDRAKREFEIIVKLAYEAVTSYDDVRMLMTLFLQRELPGFPGYSGPTAAETDPILPTLQRIIELGLVTLESQPEGLDSKDGTVETRNLPYVELAGAEPLVTRLAGLCEAEEWLVTHTGESPAMLRAWVSPSRDDLVTFLSKRYEGPVADHIEEIDGEYVFVIPHRAPATIGAQWQKLVHAVPEQVRPQLAQHEEILIVCPPGGDSAGFFDRVVELIQQAHDA